MNDPELIELRNKFLLGILVAVVFCVPIIVFMSKNMVTNDSDIYSYIKNRETFIIFVEEKRCSECDKVKDILDSKNVSYYVLNIVKTNDYLSILIRLNFSEDSVTTPGIIYVDEGKLYSYLFNIVDDEQVNNYISLNKLENTK